MMQKQSPKVVDVVKFANCKVLDENGQPIILGSLFSKQKVIFIFLRHFACIACRSHAKQVWSEREMYEKTGAKIVFIGNGSYDFIKKFKEDLNITNAIIYTDPSLISFSLAGFKKGFLSIVNPTSAINITKLMIQEKKLTGHSTEAGNLWQLGGILVVKPDCTIPYHYISVAIGDFPPNKDVQTQ